MPFATTWIDLEDMTPSEISQTEKDKYRVIPLIGGISDRNQTMEYNKIETSHPLPLPSWSYSRAVH